MFTIDFLPGLIMGFREGLEAFLIIAIMLEYLNKSDNRPMKKYVYRGLGIGILASIVFGTILLGISSLLEADSNNIAKLWESIASFAALILITTFVYWMINNRNKISGEIKNKMKANLSKTGIVLLSSVMVAREGAEIALFIFASLDPYSYLIGTIIGIIISGIIVFLIYKSMIMINLKVIFNITLVYLILQAGFMLGYSVHEFLSYLKAVNALDSGNILFTKMFDLSGTFLNHKEEIPGIMLYATIGWYSKPEVIQFVIQYLYTSSLLYFFIKTRNK